MECKKIGCQASKKLTTASRFHSPQSLGRFTFVDTLNRRKYLTRTKIKNGKNRKEKRTNETWQFRHGRDCSPILARPSQNSFLVATDCCERSIEDTESLEKENVISLALAKYIFVSTLTPSCRVCPCEACLFPSPKNPGLRTHFG